MATKKSTSKPAATKKTAAKPAKRAAAKTATTNKPTANKVAAKKSSAKKTAGRKYSTAALERVAEELHAMHRGRLKSGSGETVTNPKQAIAIALSEARRAGKKVPPNPNSPEKK